MRCGTPSQKEHGTSGWKYYGIEMGYPVDVKKQSPVKTLHSPSFVYQQTGYKATGQIKLR